MPLSPSCRLLLAPGCSSRFHLRVARAFPAYARDESSRAPARLADRRRSPKSWRASASLAVASAEAEAPTARRRQARVYATLKRVALHPGEIGSNWRINSLSHPANARQIETRVRSALPLVARQGGPAGRQRSPVGRRPSRAACRRRPRAPVGRRSSRWRCLQWPSRPT